MLDGTNNFCMKDIGSIADLSFHTNLMLMLIML